MELLMPAMGLVFWMTLIFLILFFILKKYAWPVILKTIHDREKKIEEALFAADRAKDEMLKLQANNEELLRQAQEQREHILREARELKDKILEEARAKANTEYYAIMSSAKENIRYEKMVAITEIKNQVASFSIEIAEKLIREELKDPNRMEEIAHNLSKDIKFK